MYPKSKHSLVLENGLRTNLEFSAPIYDCYYHWPNSLRKSNHKEEGITIHLFFLGIGLQAAEHYIMREGDSEVDTTTAQPLFLEEEGAILKHRNPCGKSPGDLRL